MGKTTLAWNSALALARKKKRVLLLDADFGLANLDTLLGIKAKHTLADVVYGDKEMADITVDCAPGIKLIPAASGRLDMAQLSLQQQAIIIRGMHALPFEFDVFMIDTASGLSHSMLNMVYASEHVVVVLTDEPTSLVDTYALIKLLAGHYKIEHFRVVMNMVHDTTSGQLIFNKLRQMTDLFLEVCVELVAMIPFDEHVRRSHRYRQSIYDAYPAAPA